MELDIPHRTAGDCYRAIATPAHAGRPWLVTERRTVTLGELRTRIEAIAGLLSSLGVVVGDRVVVATRDDAEAALLFVALVCNGVTVVNLDPDTGVERAQSLIRRADATLLLMDRELAGKWHASEQAARLVEIVATPTSSAGLLGRLMGKSAPAEGLHALLASTTPQAPPDTVDERTLAYILFTSGTTDRPKGVGISHRALFAHLRTLGSVYGYDTDSRIFNSLALSHADGMIQGPVIGFCHQACVFRPMRFEVTRVDALLDAIYRLRITHMVTVPTVLSLIVRLGLDQRDAFLGGDFRLLVSCGAQLEKRLWEDFRTVFRAPLVNVYGLTETVIGGVFAGPDADTGVPGSIGVPRDCRLRIVDEAGRDVAPGEKGELLLQGDNLMSGYYGDPELTARVLRDGWLHTGDLARQDADGLYWIVGRVKNIIIRGGYNISPEEITEVLHRHPGVREAIVFGVGDAVWGETVAALVVADPGVEVASLHALCNEQLEAWKVPSRIQRVEALPRGRSGKVVIDEAKALFEAGATHAARSTAAPDHVAERLLRVAAASFNTEPGKLSLHSTPDDVPGWDSLAHMELVIALEKEFAVQFSARDIMALDRLDKALSVVDA